MGKKPRRENSTSEVTNNQKSVRYDANNHNGRAETTYNSSKQQYNKQQANEAKYDHRIHDSKDYSSFKVVLFYCSLIVFLPVLTFFVLKAFLLDSIFTLTEIQGNIYAAMGAVISLHVALAVYIYRAYFSAGSSSGDSTYKKMN